MLSLREIAKNQTSNSNSKVESFETVIVSVDNVKPATLKDGSVASRIKVVTADKETYYGFESCVKNPILNVNGVKAKLSIAPGTPYIVNGEEKESVNLVGLTYLVLNADKEAAIGAAARAGQAIFSL